MFCRQAMHSAGSLPKENRVAKVTRLSGFEDGFGTWKYRMG